MILSHPAWEWFIICLCRGNDSDRAPKFYKALDILGSGGIMGNLDDGPEQEALDDSDVESTILNLLPGKHFDMIISHNPNGEYTRHIRHEETAKAVIKLWHAGKINADELWIFAYEDGIKKYYPRPIRNASVYRLLTKRIWLRKYKLITETYGFDKKSWEANTTTKAESFWKFTSPEDAEKWLMDGGVFK
jgi:hypothetical protein